MVINLNNGFIIQYGTIQPTASGQLIVTLPISFSSSYTTNRCQNLYSNSNNSRSIRSTTVQTYSLNQIKFWSGADAPVMWMCIGY